MLVLAILCIGLLFRNISLVDCIQLARNPTVPEVDHSIMVRHHAYVDFKLRQHGADILNHQDWHNRHVVPSPILMTYISTLTVVPLPSNASIQSSTMSSSSPSSWVKPSVSLSSMPPQRSQPLLAVQMLQEDRPTISLDMGKSSRWETEVAQACVKHLGALHGIASNPSGQAVCYNIQSFDNHTGTFHADIRLYRLGPGQGDWAHLQASPLTIGLSYFAASVQLQKKQIRDGIFNGRSLPLSLAQADRGSTSFLNQRSESPQFLQSLALLGQVNEDPIKELKNM